MSTPDKKNAHNARYWATVIMMAAALIASWLAVGFHSGGAEEKQTSAIEANAEEIVDVQQDLEKVDVTIKEIRIEQQELREMIYKNQKEILQAINAIGK